MSTPQSPSGNSTPNARFAPQARSAEDILKEQTVGLVHLSDFRKRRAEALNEVTSQDGSGASTPEGRESAPNTVAFKKRKKVVKKGGLSFGDDEGDDGDESAKLPPLATTKANTHGQDAAADDTATTSDASSTGFKKRLKPNAGVTFAPKSQTRSALAKEAQMKEALRKQYLQIQEAVKATEFILPFVLFDGKDSPGGKVRMKKGDHIWLFLERARKVGAEMAGKSSGISRKDWARISVDDLMIVRQDIIIPQHYDFHHFILNKSVGYHGPIFSLASVPTSATPTLLLIDDASTLGTIDSSNSNSGISHPLNPSIPDQDLEGFSDDAGLTRVVDRRWYERNKHIYPASLWEEFDAQRDYTDGGRKDREGNQMFFSR